MFSPSRSRTAPKPRSRVGGRESVGIGGCECDEAGLEQGPARSLGGRAVPADERRSVEAQQPAALGEGTNRFRVGCDRAAALGVTEHRHEPRLLDPSGGIGDNGDRVFDLEPRARELDQDATSPFEHELGGSRAAISVGIHLPATPQIEPPAAASGRIAANDSWNSSIRAGRARKRVPRGMDMRGGEEDAGAGLEGEAAQLESLLDRFRAVVPGRDDVGVDIDERRHLPRP